MPAETLRPFVLIEPTSPGFDPVLGEHLLAVERAELGQEEWQRFLAIGLRVAVALSIACIIALLATSLLLAVLEIILKTAAVLGLIIAVNLAAFGVCQMLSRHPKAESTREDQDELVPIHRDDRYSDYVDLLAYLKARNARVEVLNHLMLRLTQDQLDVPLASRAVQGFTAMREEDERLHKRIQYLKALARQGPLGSKPIRTAADTTTLLQGLQGSIRLETRKRDSADLDARLIAALEVATLDTQKH